MANKITIEKFKSGEFIFDVMADIISKSMHTYSSDKGQCMLMGLDPNIISDNKLWDVKLAGSDESERFSTKDEAEARIKELLE